MADTNDITPSRRGVVLYGAAFISAATMAMPVFDRAFAAIDDHRQKRGVFEAFCNTFEDPGETEGYDMVSDAEKEAWETLCQCEPETLAGATAMARYIADFTAKDGILHDSDVLAALDSLALSLERIVKG
jgi:hypothetical protein